MWTIRQEQTEAFRQHHLRLFEDEMVEHLKKFTPQHWKLMGEPSGRRAIQLGLAQASQYGFTDRGPARFYIDLMFMFGSYFDTDPQHPWAMAVLKSTRPEDQTMRADRLFAAMNEYFVHIVKPERRRLIDSLRTFCRAQIEDYLTPSVSREEAMLQCALLTCPLRSEYLGEQVLRKLIRQGMEFARAVGFSSDKGVALVVVLTFVAGHGFYKDPQYRWIAQLLDSQHEPDARKRVEDLSSKSALYLEGILSGSEE